MSPKWLNQIFSRSLKHTYLSNLYPITRYRERQIVIFTLCNQCSHLELVIAAKIWGADFFAIFYHLKSVIRHFALDMHAWETSMLNFFIWKNLSIFKDLHFSSHFLDIANYYIWYYAVVLILCIYYFESVQ